MSYYSDLILAHGSLRGYWRLGEGSEPAVDETGGGLNLSQTGGITWSVAGALVNDTDTGVTFDGSTGFLARADNAAFDLGDGPLSIEFWVKRSATQSATQVLVFKGTGAYQVNFTSTNRIAFIKGGAGSVFQTNATLGAITDTASWHHVVATKNGSARAIYFDGVDRTQLFTDQTLADTATDFALGTSGANFFPGSLDEVALYGAVLTPAEVLSHYEIGRGQHRKADTATVTDAAVAEVAAAQADTATVTDATVAMVEQAQADSVSASDQVSVEPGLVEADSVSVDDAVSTEPNVGLDDTVTTSDALVVEDQAVFSDSVTPTDASAADVETVQADSVTVTDSLGVELFTEQLAADSVMLTDATALDIEVALDDAVTVTDSVVSVPPPGTVPDSGGGWAMPPKLPLRFAHTLDLADLVLVSDHLDLEVQMDPNLRLEEELTLALLA